MVRDYEYDVFVSYNRDYPVGTWVENHFVKQLRGWLSAYGLIRPRIFIDKEIKTGSDWEREIELALKVSKCLIAIWSPPYFYSDWCLTELHTMLRRERLVGRRTEKNRRGLIYPIVFSDGEEFPRQFKKIQYLDMHEVNCPEEVFKKDVRYIQFIDVMKNLSEELIPMIRSAPKWSSKWPVVRKKAKSPRIVPFPSI